MHVISGAQSKQCKQKMDFADVVNQCAIVGAVEQLPWSTKSNVTQGEMFTDEVMCSSLTLNRITDFSVGFNFARNVHVKGASCNNLMC